MAYLQHIINYGHKKFYSAGQAGIKTRKHIITSLYAWHNKLVRLAAAKNDHFSLINGGSFVIACIERGTWEGFSLTPNDYAAKK